MNRTIASLLLFCVALFVAPLTASAVTIPTVPVGNPGNANDPFTGNLYGGVNYAYRIGTTEVTNSQYAEFLNAKAASDPLELYNESMGSGNGFGVPGGIARSGSSGSYTYATIAGRAEKPVNFVSWYDAIRFANWLNNGQGAGDTETGAYTLGPLDAFGVPTDGSSITRNVGATWFLTSENEWYKAAYHQNDGVTGHYFQQATSTTTLPTAEAPPGGSNSANYDSAVGDLTDVGAYTSSESPYGTFDQGGNLLEWNEALLFGFARGELGGSFTNPSFFMGSSTRGSIDPAANPSVTGFRVATVPEPSSFVLAVLGLIGLVVWKRRKRAWR